MMNRPVILLVSILLLLLGCNHNQGNDALRNNQSSSRLSTSACMTCHGRDDTPAVNPLVSNGTSTAGKHVKHVSERKIDCEHCHYGYLTSPTHMNGRLDTGDPTAAIVRFNIVGPPGEWSSAGPGTGVCSAVACHGSGAAMEWYGTAGWTLPACTTCHASSFSAELDPVSSNGTPPAGRHKKHAEERSIACERCHNSYPSLITHMNGTLDTADPSVTLVSFSITGPSTTAWRNDTNECSYVACHGPDSTVSWYGSSTWSTPTDCATCHKPEFSSALTPTITNGSGTDGKHTNHLDPARSRFACTKCHLDYPARASHANGVMDTPDPSVTLVYFDTTTNPTGTWINDTGQETGNCSSLFCHGPDTPAWYGSGGVSFSSCPGCHSFALGSRRQITGVGGDFGMNPDRISHHVAGSNDPASNQCRVCHEMSHHMSGTVYLASADSPSTTIAYETADSTTREAFCLSCHDTDGAAGLPGPGDPMSPFNDGSVLGQPPYRASLDIRANWNKTYGHRREGLTCLGSGAPDTGCHGNGHGTSSVALLAKNLTLPQPDRYRESDFALCLECHQSYERVSKDVIFGVLFSANYDDPYGPVQDPLLRSDPTYQSNPPYNLPGGIQTHFRDQNYEGTTGKYYDNTSYFGLDFSNLHWFHISRSTWYYRETTSSGISCTACHSVHGTNTQWSMLYDEMMYTVSTGTNGIDTFGTMSAPTGSLGEYPTNCAFNCHYVLEFDRKLYNWFDPPNE